MSYDYLPEYWNKLISSHVELVNGWIAPGKEGHFVSVEGKLKLIQKIVDVGEIGKEETIKLQCLGTYLGVAICEYTGWKFEIIKDEYGEDYCIKLPSKEVRIFPMTMISKRVENGEAVNVFELFTKVIPMAKDIDAKGSA